MAAAETDGNKYMFSNELSEPNSVPSSLCFEIGVCLIRDKFSAFL